MLVVVNKQESTKELQEMTELSLEYVSFFAKPQIISWLVPIMLSGQTYFRSDTTRLWPDKYTLRHTSIKEPPPPPPHLILPRLSSYCTWTWVILNSWIAAVYPVG